MIVPVGWGISLPQLLLQQTLLTIGTSAATSTMLMTVGVVVAVVGAMTVVVSVSVKIYFTYTSGRCRSTRSMAGKTVIVTGSTAGEGVLEGRGGHEYTHDTHKHSLLASLQVLGRRRRVTCCGVEPGSSSPAGTWRRVPGWPVSRRREQGKGWTLRQRLVHWCLLLFELRAAVRRTGYKIADYRTQHIVYVDF